MYKTLVHSAALLLCGALAMALLGAVHGTPQGGANAETKGKYTHIVLFRTVDKHPNGKDEVGQFMDDARRTLGKIETVRSFWVGRPTPKERSTAEVLKKLPLPYALDSYSFDVALMITFDNYDALKHYLGHKLFEEFGKEHDPLTKAILVLDFDE